MELTTDLLVAWMRERRDNCIRIAKEKTGEDRDGWTEDAFYFNEAIKRILLAQQPKGADREQ